MDLPKIIQKINRSKNGIPVFDEFGGGVKVESPDCFLLPSENTDHEEKW